MRQLRTLHKPTSHKSHLVTVIMATVVVIIALRMLRRISWRTAAFAATIGTAVEQAWISIRAQAACLAGLLAEDLGPRLRTSLERLVGVIVSVCGC